MEIVMASERKADAEKNLAKKKRVLFSHKSKKGEFSFDIENVIEILRTRRKVFSSEADFQLALAWTIKDVYRDSVDVRMEYCPDFDLNMHIDIVVFVGDKWIPIELKYKTTHVHGGIKVNKEIFHLKTHSAKPQNCYKYLWDIERIEKVRAQKPDLFLEGYAIFLTNDLSYRDVSGKGCSYEQFAISEGCKRTEKMKWAKNTSDGIKRGCEKNIDLKDEYTMRWKIFSECKSVGGEGEKFIYLINTITNKSR